MLNIKLSFSPKSISLNGTTLVFSYELKSSGFFLVLFFVNFHQIKVASLIQSNKYYF